MQSFVNNFKVLKLQHQKPQWQDPVLMVKLQKDPEFLETCGFGVNYRYVLTAEIGVEFYANEVQLGDAIDNAKKTLASRLFNDALGITQEIRQAAMDNDERKIIKLCADLENHFSAI